MIHLQFSLEPGSSPASRFFTRLLPLISSLAILAPAGAIGAENQSPGVFEGHGDIGEVLHPGAVTYDPAKASYLVAGGGENMWSTKDAFHFAWKRVSGDVFAAADVRWFSSGGNPHRKAGLVIRESLDPDSAYVDAVVHGDGLASIQYREFQGDVVHEIQANLLAPRRIGLEKQGDTVFMLAAEEGKELQLTGGAFRIKLHAPFYVGVAVCAHDKNALEQAVFTNVALTSGAAPDAAQPELESTIETIPVASWDRRVVYHTRDHIEAPNWSRDGNTLIYNSNGRLFRLPIAGSDPQPIDTGFATHCNNDHGLSPDGRLLAISDASRDGKSAIYIVPVEGGTPRLVTPNTPSYWHGWSPDGKTLAYCGSRNGEFDVYTISVDGGDEKRMTTTLGLDDGPEYSPDGQFIYFNSDRTGRMQIWRMNADGSEQTPVTSDEYNNWFAHPSPDGRWIVFLSYDGDVKGHPANKDVMLRLMPAGGGEIRVLAKLFGGQGTINVPSWSPDSARLAFVSYQLIRR
jgi:Tol biopolymer transport system component